MIDENDVVEFKRTMRTKKRRNYHAHPSSRFLLLCRFVLLSRLTDFSGEDGPLSEMQTPPRQTGS